MYYCYSTRSARGVYDSRNRYQDVNEGCKSHLRGFACPRRTHKRTCSSRPPHADKSGYQRVGYWFYCRRRIRSIPIQERLLRSCQCRCFQDDMRIKIFRSTWGRDACWFNLAIHAQSPRHPSVKWRCSGYAGPRPLVLAVQSQNGPHRDFDRRTMHYLPLCNARCGAGKRLEPQLKH